MCYFSLNIESPKISWFTIIFPEYQIVGLNPHYMEVSENRAGIFPEINHPAIGDPPFMETPRHHTSLESPIAHRNQMFPTGVLPIPARHDGPLRDATHVARPSAASERPHCNITQKGRTLKMGDSFKNYMKKGGIFLLFDH